MLTSTTTVRLLGPLAVTVDGVERPLGSPKQRAVFAVLASAAGQVVSTDRLVAEVWGRDAPATALSTLQVYISRLRRSLGEVDGPSPPPHGSSGLRLLRRPPGYLLDVEEDEVDARRFGRLLSAARLREEDEPAVALAHLDEALALVAGPPLADVSAALGDGTAAEVARLEEMVLLGRETRLAALLGLGDAAAVVGASAALVEEHPLREGLWALRMLALYRAGRQAEALASYERARRHLADELGIDPGSTLRRLHAQVLRHDPALDRAGGRGQVWHGSPASDDVRGSGRAPSGTVGRDEHLSDLAAALDHSRTGEGSVWLVEGDAGIGKTDLSESAARAGAAAGVRTVWGRAHETAAGAPYWPWTQVLRAMPEVPATGAAGVVLGTGGAAVGSEPSARIHLYDEIARVLLARSADPALLLLLEDLQWADEPSLELLAVLAERSAPSGLVLVCTYRPVGPPDSPLATLLARLARFGHVHRVRLEGLRPAELTAVVRARLGDGITDDVLRSSAERSEGNPFFAIELARLGRADGTPVDAAVPPTVRDVLLRRIWALAPRTRTLLTAACVVGRRCDLAMLEQLTGWDVDALDAAIGEGVAAGLVREHLQPRPAVEFTHALVRETLYADARPMARARLHSGIATVLEAEGEAVDLDALAFHLAAGAAVVGAGTAVPVLLQAARRAAARTAYEHSGRLLQQAAQLLAHVAPGSRRDELELRLEVHRGTLAAARLGWAAPETVAALDRAQELMAGVEPDLDVFSAVYGRCAALVVAADFATAEAQAAVMVSRSEVGGLSGKRWEFFGRWFTGVVAWHRGHQDVAVPQLRRAVELADDVGAGLADALLHDPGVMLRSFLSSALTLSGDGEGGDRYLLQARRAAEGSGNPFEACCVDIFASFAAVARDDVQAAAVLGERTRRLGTEHGFGLWAAVGAQVEGWAGARGAGGRDAAERRAALAALTASYEAYRGTGARMLTPFFLALRAQAERAVGEVDVARRTTLEAVASSDATGERLWRELLEDQLAGPAGPAS